MVQGWGYKDTGTQPGELGGGGPAWEQQTMAEEPPVTLTSGPGAFPHSLVVPTTSDSHTWVLVTVPSGRSKLPLAPALGPNPQKGSVGMEGAVGLGPHLRVGSEGKIGAPCSSTDEHQHWGPGTWGRRRPVIKTPEATMTSGANNVLPHGPSLCQAQSSLMAGEQGPSCRLCSVHKCLQPLLSHQSLGPGALWLRDWRGNWGGNPREGKEEVQGQGAVILKRSRKGSFPARPRILRQQGGTAL